MTHRESEPNGNPQWYRQVDVCRNPRGSCSADSEPRGARFGIWPLILILYAFSFATGCETLFPQPSKRTQLTIGEWHDSALHCEADECRHLYEVEVPEEGELRIDVYSGIGKGQPDFGLTVGILGDPAQARSTTPHQRPRRLVHSVDPGIVIVQIYAQGDNEARMPYRMLLRLDPAEGGSAKAKSAGTRKRRPRVEDPPSEPSPVVAPTPPPEPTATPPEPLETAAVAAQPIPEGLRTDVLEVSDAGEQVFVFLEAGQPDGLEIGQQGLLVHDDQVIGQIEIVEVFRDGSQATVLGELIGEIGIDTKAVIPPSP